MTVLCADQHHIGVMSAVDVKALDAAMPFDFEHKAQARLTKAKQLTVGIVGFGTFGQFLARRLVQAGHKVHRPHVLPLMPH
jgi:phosphoglycerate dehydrogenase-like enzyme